MHFKFEGFYVGFIASSRFDLVSSLHNIEMYRIKVTKDKVSPYAPF